MEGGGGAPRAAGGAGAATRSARHLRGKDGEGQGKDGEGEMDSLGEMSGVGGLGLNNGKGEMQDGLGALGLSPKSRKRRSIISRRGNGLDVLPPIKCGNGRDNAFLPLMVVWWYNRPLFFPRHNRLEIPFHKLCLCFVRVSNRPQRFASRYRRGGCFCCPGGR